MNYEEVKDLTLQLSYRDKFRLAQLLIQNGRKEEEEQYVEKVKEEVNIDISYIIERLLKSRPRKLQSLMNFIDAMFQFKGSISEDERLKVIELLKRKKVLTVDNNKVTYLI
ncbi:hypothetical protein MN869_18975 [Acinetobacter sp. NIPH1876]|uniref:hypothetical protein n=1 Tax=Acinetobacter sp. NIPH1876 TaxID=2924041 RepID=UPI001FABA6F2|nr:hypothetical protein [Acinetobacter sp. NIPH1876]MCJ0830498.1 hypothetical protein [Acinetobacter sp. NIPH1876]